MYMAWLRALTSTKEGLQAGLYLRNGKVQQ
jgi:hypothetical protein